MLRKQNDLSTNSYGNSLRRSLFLLFILISFPLALQAQDYIQDPFAEMEIGDESHQDASITEDTFFISSIKNDQYICTAIGEVQEWNEGQLLYDSFCYEVLSDGNEVETSRTTLAESQTFFDRANLVLLNPDDIDGVDLDDVETQENLAEALVQVMSYFNEPNEEIIYQLSTEAFYLHEGNTEGTTPLCSKEISKKQFSLLTAPNGFQVASTPYNRKKAAQRAGRAAKNLVKWAFKRKSTPSTSTPPAQPPKPIGPQPYTHNPNIKIPLILQFPAKDMEAFARASGSFTPIWDAAKKKVVKWRNFDKGVITDFPTGQQP